MAFPCHYYDMKTARPNVLLIVVDSLRADHLGCYGYYKNTSPRLDELASEGVLFNREFAAGIPTTPSFTTLLTGLHPYRHGVVAHGGDMLLDKDVLLLPELFQKSGYTTIGIDNLVVQGNGRGSWFARGFAYYSAFTYQPFGEQSTQLADRTLRFLREFGNGEEPFFLFLHLWTPHSPYAPPPPYNTMHYQPESISGLPGLEEIKASAPQYYDWFLDDMKLEKPDDVEWILAQYDGEISYADSQIGRILDELKVLGLDDDTLIFVTSDHGECFGEGGLWFDHHGLYDANLRLAMIARAPCNWECSGLQRDTFLSHEDILPTLVECCGLQKPEYSLTGESFAPLLFGETFDSKREFLVSVESSRQASISLRTSKWKLIVPITQDAKGNMVPNVYGNRRDERVLLFDLENDPQEKMNVTDAQPAILDQLQEKLRAWREREVSLNNGRDPLLESGLGLPFEEFMSKLQSRGLRG